MTDINIEKILIDQQIRKIELIEEGWSFDKLYLIHLDNGLKQICRVAPIEKKDYKKREFELIEKAYAKGIATHKPLEFKVDEINRVCYLLVDYIPGKQAEFVLSDFSKEKQYDLGVSMGKDLKKIHEIEVNSIIDWQTTYTKRIQERIEEYYKSGYRSDKIEQMIEYINDNLYLLEDRPICHNHGDFHAGNIIINPKGKAFVIDYNRHRVADAYHDFNRIYFSYRVSPYFAKGQIEGYFNNQVPKHFFKYMKFYILSVVIGSISWAMMFEQSDVDFAKRSIEEIYYGYDELKLDIPKWYKKIDY